ncbi:YhdP family phospholipid transporter [Larsenimonas rhizosphaerae]|uniref:YhdP family phospholipid transporter n=1 Tax=Larsenimonas rhizosphaerae TaxID=2944682 RepID=UPI00203361A9|nr:hypothetical protein [Larsenimonas rhizosphaerae]
MRALLRLAVMTGAALLVVVAIALSALRMGVLSLPSVQPMVLNMMGIPDDAGLAASDVSLRFVGFDPRLKFDHLRLDMPERKGTAGSAPRPMLSIDSFSARIDGLASLRAGALVMSRLDISRPVVHFYQNGQGQWPWDQSSSSSSRQGMTLERLDAWAALLSRQRFHISDAEAVLHGQQDTLRISLPRVALFDNGDDYQLEAWGHVGQGHARGLQIVAVLPQTGSSLDARLQLDVAAHQALSLWSVVAPPGAVTPAADEGQATVHARWQQGQLTDVSGRLSVPELDLASGDVHVIKGIGARFWLERREDGWVGLVNNLSALAPGQNASVLPERLSLTASSTLDAFTLHVPALALGPLQAWWPALPLPTMVTKALTAMSPRGEVTGAALGWKDGWTLQLAGKGIETSPWEHAPAGGPLDIWVDGTSREGVIKATGRDAVLKMPRVLATPWDLDSVTGGFYWTHDASGWVFGSSTLDATRRGASATGSLRIALPVDGDETMAVRLSMKNVNAKRPKEWLPLNALSPEISTWLGTNIISGHIPDGSLALNLVFNGPGPDKDRVRLDMDVKEGAMRYVDGWPALTDIDGHVSLRDDTFDARIDHASQNGMVTHEGRVSYQNDVLEASAPVSGNASRALAFLQQAPLDASLSQSLAQWRVSGPLTGMVNVRVPMTEKGQADIRASGRIDKGRALFLPADITTTDIAGTFDYRHHGNTDDLTGDFTGRVFEDVVRTRVDLARNLVTFDGRAHAQGVTGWLGIDGLTNSIHGAFDYHAALHLKDSGPVLTLESPMKGLAVNLPEPFAKLVDRSAPLSLEMNFGQGTGELTFEDRVRARWRHSDAQGQIWLQRWPNTPDWPDSDHWYVHWDTDRLAPREWIDPLAELSLTPRAAASAQAGEDAFGSSVRPINQLLARVGLNAGCLDIAGHCQGPLTLYAEPHDGQWQVRLRSALASGLLRWAPQALPTPIDVHLDRLDLSRLIRINDTSMTETATRPADVVYPLLAAGERVQMPFDVNPFPSGMGSLPPGQISIDRINYEGHQLGPLNSTWQSSARSLQLSPLTLSVPGSRFKGELIWEKAGERSLTRLNGHLKSGDLADTVALVTPKPSVHTQSADSALRLAWPGAPWQVALERINGHLDFSTGSGRLLFVDSNLAKLVGAVNLDNLVRRLMFNFSDLTQEGVAFKSIKGAASLYEGRLVTDGPVRIDGTSTPFAIDGQVDFIQQMLDARLSVTVPVSQNLPLAALAVGAPQVGGVLWLFHEIFEGWLNDVSQIHYRVKGPWGAPHLRLENAQ